MLYYTRFVDGLRDDIRAVIVVQRPQNLDTTYTLALLQEEVADSCQRKDNRCDMMQYHKPQVRNAPQAQLPHMKPVYGSLPLDTTAKTPEERFRTLHAYRRARGLCDHYAEKWSRDHKCANTVRLNAMQEVLELFSITDEPATTEDSMDWSSLAPPTEQLLMAIS